MSVDHLGFRAETPRTDGVSAEGRPTLLRLSPLFAAPAANGGGEASDAPMLLTGSLGRRTCRNYFKLLEVLC